MNKYLLLIFLILLKVCVSAADKKGIGSPMSEFVLQLRDLANKSQDSTQAKALFHNNATLKKYSSFINSPSERYWQIVVKPGISAREVCQKLNLKKCYLISGDVHQTSFKIEVWTSDFADEYGPHISAEMPKIGQWRLDASGERPTGELPKLSAGASSAYDLNKYDTFITSFMFDREDNLNPKAHEVAPIKSSLNIEGLIAMKIVSSKTIEIRRDRSSLIGLQGLETERINQGGSFILGDADHISLKYTFIEIAGDKIILEEQDQSELLLKQRQNTGRKITLAPFDLRR